MSFHMSIQTPAGNPEFVNLEARYKCLLCRQVLRDAMQTSCGHRICQECVPRMFEGKEEPVLCLANEEDCLMQNKTDIIPDPSGRREVSRLAVYCSHRALGCPEKKEWRFLEEHVQTCEFRPVDCPNKEYGCMELIAFNDTNHKDTHCQFRLEPCQYCNELVPYIRREAHINDVCLGVELPCPYSCGSHPMNRNELNRHKETCSNRPSECRFKSVGCSFVGTEEQVAQHMVNDISSHLEKVTVYTASMDMQSMEIRRELQSVTSERDKLKEEVMKYRNDLTNIEKKLEQSVKTNKEMKIKMVSLTERLIQIERKYGETPKKADVDRHERDVKALQMSLTQLRSQVAQIETRPGGATGGASGSDVADVKRRLDQHDTQFANLDVQMAELDLRFQILETASYNGELLWKLRDYNRRKQEAINGRTLSLYSQPFYTHRFGYKMCARVYLNGDGMGKGTHLSLFFVVMKGEFDNLLPWPFQRKVTMVLLDQETGQTNLSDTFRPDPKSTSFQKPTSDMNIASGCPLFVAHNILETPKYLKDDMLFLKVIVDTSNLVHP